jgi:hypothetical protein
VAGRQLLFAGGCNVVPVAPGGRGLGTGTQAAQPGLPCADAHLAQLIADPLRCPGGFDRVGVAQVQQRPVRHTSHVEPVDRAEGGQRLAPAGRDGGTDHDRQLVAWVWSRNRSRIMGDKPADQDQKPAGGRRQQELVDEIK